MGNENTQNETQWNIIQHLSSTIPNTVIISICAVWYGAAGVRHPLKITVAIIFNESVDKHPMQTHSISVSFAQKLTTRK